MKINNQHFIPLLIFAFSAIKCTSTYIPNVVNVPLLSNKGEIQVGAYSGFSGYDFQTAYAVTDNIGVIVNGNILNKPENTSRSYLEFGSGYYSKIEKHGRVEIYAGSGLGQIKNTYSNPLWVDNETVNSFRPFIQPSIGLTTDVADVSISTRFVMARLTQKGTNVNTGYFLEPAITAKLGYKYIKAIMQVGFSFPLNEPFIKFKYQPFIFSLGLQMYLFKKH